MYSSTSIVFGGLRCGKLIFTDQIFLKLLIIRTSSIKINFLRLNNRTSSTKQDMQTLKSTSLTVAKVKPQLGRKWWRKPLKLLTFKS